MICSKLDSAIKIEPLAMKFKTFRRLPIFLQPTHLANFATAESSTVTVVESAVTATVPFKLLEGVENTDLFNLVKVVAETSLLSDESNATTAAVVAPPAAAEAPFFPPIANAFDALDLRR
mgnify:CR=1 FL=1